MLLSAPPNADPFLTWEPESSPSGPHIVPFCLLAPRDVLLELAASMGMLLPLSTPPCFSSIDGVAISQPFSTRIIRDSPGDATGRGGGMLDLLLAEAALRFVARFDRDESLLSRDEVSELFFAHACCSDGEESFSFLDERSRDFKVSRGRCRAGNMLSVRWRTVKL